MAVYYGLDELIDDVGARLDIGNPTASTTPTEAQITVWLNQAQLDIVNKATNDAVPTLWAEQTILGAALSAMESGVDYVWQGALATDFIRPVYVELWKNPISEETLYPVFLLSREMALAFQKNALYAASNSRPLGWFWGNSIYVAMGDKNAADEVHIFYIKEPSKLSGSTESSLPHVFQEYMVRFAEIQAKKQDGKIEELPALTAAYEQGIQLINMQAAQSYYGIRGR